MVFHRHVAPRCQLSFLLSQACLAGEPFLIYLCSSNVPLNGPQTNGVGHAAIICCRIDRDGFYDVPF